MGYADALSFHMGGGVVLYLSGVIYDTIQDVVVRAGIG